MLSCKGYWSYSDCGDEFECDYPHADFSCEDCIINGGPMSPQTGKPFRGNREKYIEAERNRGERQSTATPLSIDDCIKRIKRVMEKS